MDIDWIRKRLANRAQLRTVLQEKRPSYTQMREVSSTVFDLLTLLSIALLVLAIDHTPTAFQQDLVLNHNNPAVIDLWSTHFVHSQDEPQHLRNNVKGYLLVGAFAYVVSIETERRPSFKMIFAALFLIGAPVISIVNLVLLEPTAHLIDPTVTDISNRGLSSINAGLVGYLLIATADLGRKRLPIEMSIRNGVRIAVWSGLILVLWKMFQLFGTRVWFIGLPIVLLIMISLYAVVRSCAPLLPPMEGESRKEQVRILGRRAWQWLRAEPFERGGIAFLVAAGFFTVIVLIGLLISLPPLIDGKNTIGHAAGLVLGTVLAWGVFRWETAADHM